jgi:hypothetical protein
MLGGAVEVEWILPSLAVSPSPLVTIAVELLHVLREQLVDIGYCFVNRDRRLVNDRQ